MTNNCTKNGTLSRIFSSVCCLMLLMGLMSTSAFAQTERITPAGDGSFSNGTTFAANGWTAANSASVNQWVCGTAVATAPFAGRSAYTSNDAGVTNNYTNTANTLNYFYRNVTIPSGETAITLTYNWISNGESTWDAIQVFTCPTSTTPAGSTTYPGSGLNLVPAGLTSAVFVGSSNLQTTVQTATFTLPGSLAGTTFRLVFAWKSDSGGGTSPGGSVDNISLTSSLPTPTTCASTYTPSNGATGVATTQVLSWSGATGLPAPTYDVYFSTNSSLVSSMNVSARVSTGSTATTNTQTLAFSTTYYWMVVPINGVAGSVTSCTMNSFTTGAPSTYTATAAGGLWSSPATWVGGVVPGTGNDISIPSTSVVTVDQVINYRNYSIDGVMQWNGTANAMTVTGDFTINAGGRFYGFTSGAAGVTCNLLGNFTNNGYANLAYSVLIFGGTGSFTLGGTGSYEGVGGVAEIATLQVQVTGNLGVSPQVAVRTFSPIIGTVSGASNIYVDNVRTSWFGQARNQQINNIVVTAMGSGYVTAPVVGGSAAALWAAGATAIGALRINNGHQYVSLDATAATVGNAPTHTNNAVAVTGDGKNWLHVGPVGVIGNAFASSSLTPVAGTQYYWNGNLYYCTIAGAMTIANINAALPFTSTLGAAQVVGGATFRCVGTAASISLNWDATTQTVRSASVVSAGSGYTNAVPVATVVANTTGSGATISIPSLFALAGATNSLVQKQASTSMIGTPTINSSQGVGGVTVSSDYGFYLTTPTIGIGGPTGINFVTAQGTGYAAAPTVAFTGGTIISGANTFSTVVANGKVLSITLSTSALYSVPPTGITITGANTTPASAALPANCWAQVAAVLNGAGQLSSFTVSQPGFGYVAAPTMALSTAAAGERTATTPACKVGLYNLTCSNFTASAINGSTPTTVNGVHNEATNLVAFIPSNRRINVLASGAGSQGINLTGNLTMYASATPLTLTSGAINLGGNTLTYENPGFFGQSSGASSWVENGSIVLNGISAATLTRTFPFRANGATGAIQLNIGSGSLATGSDITQIRASVDVAPTGTAAGVSPVSANMVGTRTFKVEILAGTAFGAAATQTMLLGYDGSDNIPSDNPSVFLCQSNTGTSSGWNIRSAAGTAGALPATGTRTSATTSNGPITYGSTMYFAWATTYVAPPALAYSVSRLTNQTYQSIAPVINGGDGTGTLSTASGDETTQTGISIAATGFTYQGSAVSSISIHPNGMIILNNGLYSYTSASNWDNTLSSAANGFSGTSDFNKRNVIAPFYDDLNKPSPVIYYKVSGTKTTVEWYNTTFFGLAGPQLYYQVVLDGANNSIRMNYGDIQMYNGTQNIRWSYTCGISGAFVQAIPQAGQIMQQQYENTTFFTHENASVAGWGANGLSESPTPHSSIVFTPGVYSPVAAPTATAPANDDFGGAVLLTAQSTFPSNIAWNYVSGESNLYSTKYSTHSAQAVCAGPNTAKDVWFQFVALQPDMTVRLYASGGFIPRVQVMTAGLLSVNCSVGTVGNVVSAVLTGLSAGNTYLVRVSHDQVGTTASVTANISGGSVSSLNFLTNGSGYQDPTPGFTYNAANRGSKITFTGGGGTGAAAGITSALTGGALTSSNVSITGGSGYTSAPTVTVDSPDYGITGEFGIIVYASVANDECASAITLTPTYGATCTNLGNASQNQFTGAASASADAAPSCGLADDDIWYKFVATSNNTTIDVQGFNSFDPAMQIWSGASCAAKAVITPTNCFNATGGSGLETTTITTTVGTTYYVRVYEASTGSGVLGGYFNICVKNNCLAPTVGTTAPINSYDATVSWTGNGPTGTTTDIEYGVSPFTFVGTPSNAAVTGLALTGSAALGIIDAAFPPASTNSPVGLSASTNYNAKIRSQCAAGQYSVWVTVPTFLTLDPPCAGTPNAGTVTPSASAVCSTGQTINFTFSGYSNAPGISWQWQRNINGAGWFNVGTLTSPTYSDLVTLPTQYRVTSTCSFTSLSDTSPAVSIAVNTLAVTPTATVCGGYVANLTATGADAYSWSTGTSSLLINPATVGGFTAGGGFAGNGWSVSNSASANQWVVGTAVATSPFSGNVAYTSNDAGVTNSYDNTSSTLNYFWRDVTVPSGESEITLSFDWISLGENTWDIIQVYSAPTSITPVGTTTYPGSGTGVIPTGITGATLIGFVQGQPLAQNSVFTLSPSLAGTTFRLIFSWKSDTSVGTSPAGTIDNIRLISSTSTVGDGLNTHTGASVVATPAVNTTYTVTGELNGCFTSANSVVTVQTPAVITVTNTDPKFCGVGGTSTLAASSSASPAYSYTWTESNSGTLNTLSGTPVVSTINYLQTTSYVVTGDNGVCSTTATASVSSYAFPVITPTATPATVCVGGTSIVSVPAPTGAFSVTSIGYSPQSPGVNPVTNLVTGGVATVPQSIVSLDDGGWFDIPMGFTYNFFGTNFSALNISTNGNCQFGAGGAGFSTSFSPGAIPSATTPNGFASIVWSDLLLSTSGDIDYYTAGAAPNRVFVVRFTSVPFFSGGGTFTGQVEFYETIGTIEVHIATATGASNKLVGVENLAGTVGSSAPGFGPSTSTMTTLSWRFSPPIAFSASWAPGGEITGATTGFSVTASPTATLGAHTYTATITDLTSLCFTDNTVDVTVSNAAPVANISATPAIGTSGGILTTHTMVNNSTYIGTPTFAWTFTPNTMHYVNATSASDAAPQVQFDAAGTYSVSLTITGCGGQQSTATLTNYFTITNVPCYPTYSNLCTSLDYINDLSIFDANNNPMMQNLATGCNGNANNYISYQSSPVLGITTANLIQGNTYTVVANSDPAWSQGFAVWLDINGDGDFIDANEFLGSSASPTTSATFNIAVPSDAASLGFRNMRVRCAFAHTFLANEYCNNQSFGECEDYKVKIVQPVQLNDIPTYATPVSYSSNLNFPNCYALNGSTALATNSPESGAASGPDVWYSFVAQSSAVSIEMTSATMDNVIALYTKSGSVYTLVPGSVENVGTGGVGAFERLNIGGLTPLTTYYASFGAASGTTGGPFTFCVKHLMRSGCATVIPVGGVDICSAYKAVARGSVAQGVTYNFTFTGTGGGAVGTATQSNTNGLTTMSNAAFSSVMLHGGIYTVKVDANYNLTDGSGAADPTITIQGVTSDANCTGVQAKMHALVEVKSTQRCPASLLRGNYLIGTSIGNVAICGVLTYTYEFQQVVSCSDTTTAGGTYTYTTAGASPYLTLNVLPTGPNIGYWRVRVRPNFVYGAGSYGPKYTIAVSGTTTSAMAPEDHHVNGEEKSAVVSVDAKLYPNPNNGEMVNLNVSGVKSDNVFVRVLDAMGRVVYTNRFTVDGSLNTIVTFAQPLASGIYNVEFTVDGSIMTERMIVTKQ